MIYQLNKDQTLEGSAEEIIEALLTDHREHLYRHNKVTLVNPQNDAKVYYYKAKTNYCPTCGMVHGSRIQLIPKNLPNFESYFNPAVCTMCRQGVGTEVEDWMREFLEDDHETLAAAKG